MRDLVGISRQCIEWYVHGVGRLAPFAGWPDQYVHGEVGQIIRQVDPSSTAPPYFLVVVEGTRYGMHGWGYPLPGAGKRIPGATQSDWERAWAETWSKVTTEKGVADAHD